jgi:hypothetical protein
VKALAEFKFCHLGSNSYGTKDYDEIPLCKILYSGRIKQMGTHKTSDGRSAWVNLRAHHTHTDNDISPIHAHLILHALFTNVSYTQQHLKHAYYDFILLGVAGGIW